MPNWCTNELEITGPHRDIVSLIGEQPEQLVFNDMLPAPDLDAFADAGHLWRLAHWGTKWDVLDDLWGVEITRGRALLGFGTAWSPPLALIEALADAWPRLMFTLSYAESGGDFAGHAVVTGASTTLRSGSYTDICEPGGEDGDELIQRGPLHLVCAELPLDQRHLNLTAIAEEIDAAASFTLDSDAIGTFGPLLAELHEDAGCDALIFVTALSGHQRLARALVPHLDQTRALELAAMAAGSTSGAGSVIRAIAASKDPAVATIGKLFSSLGVALTVRTPGEVAWMGSMTITPALLPLLGQALAAGRTSEWAETCAGLATGWTGTIDELLTSAWELVSR